MTRQSVLIYLHTEGASWLIRDENGQLQGPITRGSVAELTPLIENSEIKVIVPGQSILLTAAELPKLNPQRVMQALPFTLEEQLIDDVNTLHFATGTYQANNSYPVAVVSKEKMDGWLATLKQANISPDALIPASLTLPFTADEWYACLYDEIGIVRTGAYTGFSCDKDNLATYLELQLAATEQKPTCIHLYNFSATPTAVKLDSVTLNEMTLSENQFLEHAAKWLETYPYINLLQGPYQITQKLTATKKIWLAACCLAIAWIGCAFFGNIGSFLILHHASATSDELINKIYQRNFPNASAVVAPKQRMEEKLKKLLGTSSKNNFLAILSMLGNNLSKGNNIQLLNMDFRGNQLTLNLTAPTFNNLDAFTQELKRQGLRVKQQSAGVAGTAIKASLLISQGTL